jgi:hypothetical protein
VGLLKTIAQLRVVVKLQSLATVSTPQHWPPKQRSVDKD